MADRIQARAIRRCGELLKQVGSEEGGRPNKNHDGTVMVSTRTEAATQAGLSERVAIGKAIEEELGKRQGQRTDLVNEDQAGLFGEQLSQNFGEVPKGRTDEIAAKKAGFGSDKTYRDAKTVTDKAVPSA